MLVACEYSGRVRQAFRDRGHDAWSCDLLPAEDESEFHYQCDIWSVPLGYGHHWDLMIAHPPCTYLSSSGERWLKGNPERQQARVDAVQFFRDLWEWPIERIAMENPIGTLSRQIRKPDQIIQPWQFGHGETKATCLWLKNLQPLKPTNIVDGREPKVHRMSPGPDRWKERSRTYQGIADAMAEQWGGNV